MSRIPAQIGNYILEHEIGHGATSEVWLAHHAHLQERQVAIKILMTQDRETVQRFNREASLTSRLQHAHIVQVYDFGYYEPFYCSIMQYVHGGSLQHLLDKQHALPPQEALKIFKQIAAALDFAHSHHIVHRDVSPGNVLIDQTTGCAYLTDFGIAREPNQPITVASSIMGTPGYWSPEHAHSAASVTTLSDIYSLGVVLYVMLSGELPWDEVPNLPERRFTAPLPLKERGVTNVPPEVDRVLQTMIAVDPTKRFPTAQAAVDELERILTRHFVTTQRLTPAPDPADSGQAGAHQFQAGGIETNLVESVLGADLVRAPIADAHERARELCQTTVVTELLNAWSQEGRFRRTMLGRLAHLHKVSSRNVYFYTLHVLYEQRHPPQILTEPDYDAREFVVEPERDLWQVRLPPIQGLQDDAGGRMLLPGSMRIVTCEICAGRGATVCPRCKGKGRVRMPQRTDLAHASAPDQQPGQAGLSVPMVGSSGAGASVSSIPASQRSEPSLVACPECEGRGGFRCDQCDGVGRMLQQKAFRWERMMHTFDSHDDMPNLDERWLLDVCDAPEIYRERADNGFRPEWSRIPPVADLLQEAQAMADDSIRVVQSELAIRFVPVSDVVFDLGRTGAGEAGLYRLSIYGFEHLIPTDWRFLNWERVIFICAIGFLLVLVLIFGFFAFTA